MRRLTPIGKAVKLCKEDVAIYRKAVKVYEKKGNKIRAVAVTNHIGGMLQALGYLEALLTKEKKFAADCFDEGCKLADENEVGLNFDDYYKKYEK